MLKRHEFQAPDLGSRKSINDAHPGLREFLLRDSPRQETRFKDLVRDYLRTPMLRHLWYEIYAPTY